MSSGRPFCDVLVIGGASLDLLHFAGRSEASAGGAGLYTSLAAARSGARAAMYAPVPDPVPAPLALPRERIHWFGPVVAPEELPRFEIEHHGEGRATLRNAVWGAERELAPEGLPGDLSGVVIHIGALRDAGRQWTFLEAARVRGAALVAVGTYAVGASREPDLVRRLMAAADVAFMNENEASILFGSVAAVPVRVGQLAFVTRGSRGASVRQGDHATELPACPTEELDPTGAGDSFCGATLAALARGEHPVEAARAGIAMAAETIAGVGPLPLLEEGPLIAVPGDDRCLVDRAQVARVAAQLRTQPDIEAFPFTGELFPLPGAPEALDFFFAATLQQYGFWQDENGRWAGSLVASRGGRPLKGSDYLWAAYLSGLAREPGLCSPASQAMMTVERLAALFLADDGTQPMPQLEERASLARRYGRDMAGLAATPRSLLDAANASARPRAHLVSRLAHLAGYKEDPLRKKAALLALILEQRPERFLRPASDEPELPVIDYHLMRSCLRVGLVAIQDAELEGRLLARELLPEADERAVRQRCFEAIRELRGLSGLGMGAIDWFFFGARRRCPEATEPECARCSTDPVCAHRRTLFQPVRRTTFY